MRTRYALKALTLLAECDDRGPVLISQLSKRGEIPRKYLEAILRELKRHGILTAQRGRRGGYRLLKQPQDVSVAEVIRVLDGPLAPVPCLSRSNYRPCAECKSERACGVRLVLFDAHSAMLNLLERTSLQELVARTRAAVAAAAAAAEPSLT
ncbi:MAG TPA: Rrf2 family transcriptional regulator [Polyangiaceae bacterium]|nr:Rrf2 family transcriptional regulator [Polyangiaceae bacterium]